MAKNISDVKRIAAMIGATVEDNESGHHRTLYVDLPPGRIFNANGGHGLLTSWDLRGGKSWREDAIDDLIERMNMGVDDGCECDHSEDCDVCNPIQE